MLKYGKKNCALRDKKKYSNSLFVRKKNSERILIPLWYLQTLLNI